MEDKKELCLICSLFGGYGWRSPLIISDFIPLADKEGVEYQQEFVAIDRFTGGSADQKKFNAKYRFQPVLHGSIKIDLCRTQQAQAGLLVYVLRDLIEGDIPLGFGQSKGFGACKAQITNVSLPDYFPENWQNSLILDESLCSRNELIDCATISEVQIMVLQSLIELFHEQVNN